MDDTDIKSNCVINLVPDKELIATGAPGTGIDDFVVSATVGARKP